MKNTKQLTLGVYSGREAGGNCGWLIVTLGGGRVFVIKGYLYGLIKHNQIDQYVTSVDRVLDPEIDSVEFTQLHDQILKIGEKFPNVTGIVDELKKIVSAYSFSKYNNVYSIEFPKR